MAEFKDLKKAKVTELLSLIAIEENSCGISKPALAEFVGRYNERFWNICKEVTGKKQKFYLNLDLNTYQDAFAKVCEEAGSFKKLLRNAGDADIDRVILAWMGEFAQQAMDNIIKREDEFNSAHKLVGEYDKYEAHHFEMQLSTDEIKENARAEEMERLEMLDDKKKLDEALARLSRREREILLEYFKPKGKRKYIPEARIDYLCSRWKITREYLHQVKHRAYLKVIRHCIGNEENKETNTGSIHSGRTKAGTEA